MHVIQAADNDGNAAFIHVPVKNHLNNICLIGDGRERKTFLAAKFNPLVAVRRLISNEFTLLGRLFASTAQTPVYSLVLASGHK